MLLSLFELMDCVAKSYTEFTEPIKIAIVKNLIWNNLYFVKKLLIANVFIVFAFVKEYSKMNLITFFGIGKYFINLPDVISVVIFFIYYNPLAFLFFFKFFHVGMMAWLKITPIEVNKISVMVKYWAVFISLYVLLSWVRADFVVSRLTIICGTFYALIR